MESVDISYSSLNPVSVGIYVQTFKKINVADDGMSFGHHKLLPSHHKVALFPHKSPSLM